MQGSIHRGQDAALCAEADVPSLLVEVEVLAVKGVKEARVADVQLVGGHANDGACGGMSVQKRRGRRAVRWLEGRTIVVVQLGDVPRVLAVLDNLVVALVPRGDGSQARAREPGQGVQMQAVEGEEDDIGGEGCCEHRHEADGGYQGGEYRGHGRLGRCCQVQMEAAGVGRSGSGSGSRQRDMCRRRRTA